MAASTPCYVFETRKAMAGWQFVVSPVASVIVSAQARLLDLSGLLYHRPSCRDGFIDARQDFGNAALFVERGRGNSKSAMSFQDVRGIFVPAADLMA